MSKIKKYSSFPLPVFYFENWLNVCWIESWVGIWKWFDIQNIGLEFCHRSRWIFLIILSYLYVLFNTGSHCKMSFSTQTLIKPMEHCDSSIVANFLIDAGFWKNRDVIKIPIRLWRIPFHYYQSGGGSHFYRYFDDVTLFW